MEHRWGERIELDLPVVVILGNDGPRSAQLRNASISGCLCELPSECDRPVGTDVEILLTGVTAWGASLQLTGSIVRRTPHGYGVEWDDLCPAGIAELVDPRHPPRADSQSFWPQHSCP
jgi:hypothetical protein